MPECCENHNTLSRPDVAINVTDLKPQSRENRDMQDDLGNWIQTRLDQLGKTQAGLGTALGLDRHKANHLISGTRRLQVQEVIPLAHYLECSVTEILAKATGEEPPQEPRAAFGKEVVWNVAKFLAPKLGFSEPNEFADMFVDLCDYAANPPAGGSDSMANVVDFAMKRQMRRGSA